LVIPLLAIRRRVGAEGGEERVTTPHLTVAQDHDALIAALTLSSISTVM
jgi:hypothetical protein